MADLRTESTLKGLMNNAPRKSDTLRYNQLIPNYHAISGSAAEDLFIELFSETFGAEKAGFLYTQYHFFDIYQNDRYAVFFLQEGGNSIAIEIDDEASHNPRLVSKDKFYDDLLKQNSMIHNGWKVYRWTVRQM